MTFTLPDNTEFPLEVETRAGWATVFGVYDGLIFGIVRDEPGSRYESCSWTLDGNVFTGPGCESLDPKPLFQPQFPEFIPDGWWAVKCGEHEIACCSEEPEEHDSGQCALNGKKVRGLELLNWDQDKLFPPSWDWTKCKLQKKG